MQILLVVDNPAHWPLHVPGVDVVAARKYLTDPAYNNLRNVRLFNLCKSYSYQNLGYYVSLMAEARGHKPAPDTITIQDMRWSAISRVIMDDLDELVEDTLRTVHADPFVLSIYFGRTTAKRDQRLGLRLFNLFRCPLLRAQFTRSKGKWQLQSMRPIPTSEIPKSHHDLVVSAAERYFKARQWTNRPTKSSRYDLAILVDPDEKQPPSDEAAIKKFIRAANRKDMSAELITREDAGRIAEFDALFIRTTTSVDHYTYRFARRAETEGLAVIDDPVSIARCTNKVYLAERLAGGKVPIPRTLTLHRDNLETVLQELGLPCVLKQPDSAFSAGVTKATTEEEFHQKARAMLEDSDLIVAQAFTPTDYDWRVGVLDGEPLYACKYFMARNHWQIIQRDSAGKIIEGKAETMSIDAAPKRVIRAAVKSARLIGDGLYGVDLKQLGNKVYVIEVNDNPNLDHGYENKVLGDALYDRVIDSFIHRIERRRAGAAKR